MKSHTALIIVDLLEDFSEGGSLAVQGTREIASIVGGHLALLALLKKDINRFDEVISVQDCHPKDHCSFKTWPEHCVQGTEGAKLTKQLRPFEKLITKTFLKGCDKSVDSYSGFLDNDRKTETGLKDYLLKKNITKIYIVGVATEYCIKATALDACQYFDEVTVIEDLIAPVSKSDGAKAIADMKRCGVRFIKVKEL